MKPKLLVLVVAGICSCYFYTAAQTINRNIYTTNGPVYTTTQKGDTLYIGGQFSQIGFGVRKLARYLQDSTKPDFTFAELDQNAVVNDVEPDGNGGYYLCGSFKNYNGVPLYNDYFYSAAIIHILPDNSLDPNFPPTYVDAYDYDNLVKCLKKQGNRLYVGGGFTVINGVNHKYVAALNATTGKVISWYPDEPNGIVNKIEATDSLVFLQGSFNFIDEHFASNFAALKVSNGNYVRYYSVPNPYGYSYEEVTCIKINDNKLYLGGNFSSIGYQAKGLAKISLSAAEADKTFPETNGVIQAIISDEHGGFYIGGDFSLVNNLEIKYLAHILSDGFVDKNFDFNLDGQVTCIASDGSNIYFGGDFTRVNNQTRRHAAAVLSQQNKVTPWNPDPDGIVSAMAYTDSMIYMGGSFKYVKGERRDYAAAITVKNKLTIWDPRPDAPVHKIITTPSGTSLFIAGDFHNVNSKLHSFIAKVNNTTGDVAAWDPEPSDQVYDMALNGNKLFIGGQFYYVGGFYRQYLAEVDTATGNTTNFQADANSPVTTLKVYNQKLYVGGEFTELQKTPRKYCARINLINKIVDSWMPEPDYQVLAIAAGNTYVALGGYFSTVNDRSRNYIAAVNLLTTNIDNFNPYVNGFYASSIDAFAFSGKELFAGGNLNYNDTNYTGYYAGIISLDTLTGLVTRYFDYSPDMYDSYKPVQALMVNTGELYAGGSFGSLINSNQTSSIERYNLISYNLNNNTLTNKIYNPNSDVTDLLTDNQQRTIAAGGFNLTNFMKRGNLAAINLTSGKANKWSPFVSGEVRAMAVKDTSLFIGGTFYEIRSSDDYYSRSVYRQNLAAFSTKTGFPTAWNADIDYGSVSTLAVAGSTLYVGGNFSTIKGVSRNNAAALSTEGKGILKKWAPECNDYINAILPVGNKVYLGGNFFQVKGSTRYYLAAVDSILGIPTSWNPNPNNPVYALTANSSTLYVAGEFSTISDNQRQSVAAYKISNNSITPFNPKLKSNSYNYYSPQLLSLALYGNSLFMGSDGYSTLDSIQGVSRHILGSADTATSNATEFVPNPDNTITHLNVIGNRLFVGGSFTTLAVSPSSAYFSVFNLEQAEEPNIIASTQKATSPKNFKVGIADNATSLGSFSVSLTPNPAKDFVLLAISGKMSKVSLIITDLSGKVLWQLFNQNIQQIQIPIATFAQGVYLLTVNDGKQLKVIKFVKQK